MNGANVLPNVDEIFIRRKIILDCNLNGLARISKGDLIMCPSGVPPPSFKETTILRGFNQRQNSI